MLAVNVSVPPPPTVPVKVFRHSRKIIFQMAEVAVPRELFRDILKAIERLKLATVLSG